MTPLLAMLVVAALASSATITPVATPPTFVASPVATPSPATESPSPPMLAPTRTPTSAPRWTPQPTATPEMAADETPTPVEEPAAPGDEPPDGMPLPQPLETTAPVGAVRAFRTPEREAPPAFVAPRIELPDADDEQLDEPAPDAMPSPDLPYIATVTFRASAATEINGFELFIIYPRSGGDFVGSGRGVECRKPGDGALVADDNDAGALRIRVVNGPPLTFPLEVICKFTVEPNAILHARLIAVNVAGVTAGTTPGDPSALTVSVSAH